MSTKQQQAKPYCASRASIDSAVERERQALELRITGATYAQIGRELGYRNASGAWKAVDRARAAEKLKAGNATRLRTARLRKLNKAIRNLDKANSSGKPGEAMKAIRLSESRRKLLGLD